MSRRQDDAGRLLSAFAARVFVLAALAGIVGWVPLFLVLVVVGCWLVRCAGNTGTGERPAR